MAKTTREREYEAHQAKLERVREQVASGELVIRQMTDTERAKWGRQQAKSEARSTPAERTRRATALAARRKRAARFE